MPRHLSTIRDLIDAQTNPRKCVIHRQSAFAGNFRKGLRVGGIRTGFVGCDGAGCRVEGDQRAGVGLDQRKPAGQRIARLREGIGAGEVQDNHHRFQMQRRDWPQVVR
jgi:hypothetical protein